MTEMMISTPQRDVAKAVRMPVIYEDAVRDLVACQTLDEAKYFSDKAEALAAWAKIYKNDQAGVEAKRLKLHAYRRMGELAAQLRPPKSKARSADGTFRGRVAGPRSLLMEHGLSDSHAQAARRLKLMPLAEFRAIVNLPRPPAPTAVVHLQNDSSSALGQMYRTFMSLRSTMRRQDPVSLALKATEYEARWFRQAGVEITEWFDRFEQHLPKA